METWLQDLRYGLRTLTARRSFSSVAILTLALGIGANVAIFSVVRGVVLDPLPFPDPERLVNLYETVERQGRELRSVSYPLFLDWQQHGEVFDGIAAVLGFTANLTGGDRPERILAQGVSPGYFELLGVAPILGRGFAAAENRTDVNHPVVMLSERLWNRRFGGDNGILHRRVIINGVACSVAGVMPTEGHEGNGQELWLPILALTAMGLPPAIFESRGARGLDIVARLRDGTSLEEAQSWLDRFALGVRERFPGGYLDRAAAVVPLEQDLLGEERRTALLLMAAVSLVLLIACANVANLLLVRASGRRREMALRLAIGAERSRLVRQLLTESLLLSLVGAGLGLLLALWARDLLLSFAALEQVPSYVRVVIDGRTLLFALALCGLTGLLFGVAPALQASRSDLQQIFKSPSGRSLAGPARRSLSRPLLVVVQVALAVVLVVAAGLVLQSLERQRQIEPGFSGSDRLTFRLDLPAQSYDDDATLAFSRQLLERLSAMPGVDRIGLASDIPLTTGYSATFLTVPDRRPGEADHEPRVYRHTTAPGFFAAMGIPLRRGRDFTWLDDAESPSAVIVGETLAARLWPQQEALGRRLRRGEKELEVVGVVGDVRYRSLMQDPVGNPEDPDVYFPLAQAPSRSLGVVVQGSLPSSALTAGLRRELAQLDVDLPLWGMTTMDEVLARELALGRFGSLLLGLFSSLALVLAAVGLYGVIAYSVAQRTREIGVRMAMGARRGQVLWQVLSQGIRMSGAGISVGLLASLYFTRYLGTLLYEVSATDPATLVAGAAVLLGVAVAASYLPARRATLVDPTVALRYE